MKRLLTTPEAEEVLGLGAGSLRVDRSTGRLGVPFVALGRKSIRYRVADLEAWVASRVEVPKGARPAGGRGRGR